MENENHTIEYWQSLLVPRRERLETLKNLNAPQDIIKAEEGMIREVGEKISQHWN